MFAPLTPVFTPADSARTVGDVYSISLVATVPIIVAAVAFLVLRHSNAGTRAVMWRCAIIAVLAVYGGRFVPWHWMAWILPEPLTRPLVALGALQLVATGEQGAGSSMPEASGTITWLLVLYWSVAAVILLRTAIARIRLELVSTRSRTLTGARWRGQMREAGDAIGMHACDVRLAVSREIVVPITWGVWRPVILLPLSALRWPAGQLQAVLRHELVHVRFRDATTRLVARVACALLWFHPGVWWLAKRFDVDVEEASDDRVLLSGIRVSDYAESLAASIPGVHDDVAAAMALASRRNLRARLAMITNTRRRVAAPTRRVVVGAAALTALVVGPLSTARLAPTRDVLTSLMQEPRWESRAWAVVRLARRADSVHVARTAANHDPDPAVRAWARYALGLVPVSPATPPRS
jgi:beta-lactamase regulating signal transducer with metallopeptidase domain